MQAFTRAISDLHRAQSAQVVALLKEERIDFEIQIASAREKRDQAKCALEVHQRTHGC